MALMKAVTFSEFGGPAVDYIKDHRLIEEPAATLDELESYFRTGVPDDEPDSATTST